MDKAVLTILAPSNIAVVKYWGKRDAGPLNLPLNGSLSACLHTDDLRTTTSVLASKPAAEGAAPAFHLWLNGKEQKVQEGNPESTSSEKKLIQVVKMVRERVRAQGDPLGRANWDLSIVSKNSFPTAAGLASSASGFAAMTYSVARILGVDFSKDDCSDIARCGSGSACRSVLPEGGWVRWDVGTKADGSDSRAVFIAGPEHWPEIKILVLVVSAKQKETPSTAGMQTSVATSSKLKHRAAEIVPAALKGMEESIRARDFPKFAQICMDESDSFHGVCADTTPPIHYLNETSNSIIEMVRAYNAKNSRGEPGVAYTYDAGPNAVIYGLKDHIPAFLAQVLVQFGGSSTVEGGDNFLRIDAETRAATDAELQKLRADPAAVIPISTPATPSSETSALTYVLSTRVGPGPTVISEDLASPEHLVDVNVGGPKA